MQLNAIRLILPVDIFERIFGAKGNIPSKSINYFHKTKFVNASFRRYLLQYPYINIYTH